MRIMKKREIIDRLKNRSNPIDPLVPEVTDGIIKRLFKDLKKNKIRLKNITIIKQTSNIDMVEIEVLVETKNRKEHVMIGYGGDIQ